MSGADCLAGSSSGFHNVGAVDTVINIVGVLVPGNCAVAVVCVGDVSVGGAVLLTETESVGLAVLNALAAGNTLFLVDSCDVV